MAKYRQMNPYFDDDVKKNDREKADMIARYQEQWKKANAAGDREGMDRAHAAADAIRAQAGYTSAYSDGTGYIPLKDFQRVPYNPYIEAEKVANQKLEALKLNQIKSANQMHDDANQDAYILREQQIKSMPIQANAYGLTGGLSETSQSKIMTNYGNAVNANERARVNNINNIQAAADQQALKMAIDFADKKIAQYNHQNAFDRNVFESNRNFNRGIYENDRDYDFRYHQAMVDNEYRQNAFNAAQRQNQLDNAYRQQQLNDRRYQNDYNEALRKAQATGDYSTLKKYGWTDKDIEAVKSSPSPSGKPSRYSGSELDIAEENAAAGKFDEWTMAALRQKYPNMSDEQIVVQYGYEGKTQEADQQGDGTTNRNGNGWIEVPGAGRMSWPELQQKVMSGEIKEVYNPETKKYTYKKATR